MLRCHHLGGKPHLNRTIPSAVKHNILFDSFQALSMSFSGAIPIFFVGKYNVRYLIVHFLLLAIASSVGVSLILVPSLSTIVSYFSSVHVDVHLQHQLFCNASFSIFSYSDVASLAWSFIFTLHFPTPNGGIGEY